MDHGHNQHGLSQSQSQQSLPGALQSQAQQQQQQPQDVLAAARKNLQVLIDSGLSRDLLHQLVDDSQTLQLAIPSQSSLLQSQPQPQSPQQSHPTPQPHSNSLQASEIAPHPPPPQCPPPPPPTGAQLGGQRSPVQEQHAQHHQNVQQPPIVSPIGAGTPTLSSSNVKPELPSSDVSGMWRADATPLHCAAPSPAPGAHNQDPAMFAYQASQGQAGLLHRPRISVSSTSSGSSGHASVFSNMSSHSAVSWGSAASNPRMQAPLPLPPQLNSPTGAPIMNAGPGAALNKHNIYWCTSCETSFKRKYDWKRHEDEFHERWRKYPCPEPGCNRSFWGSNSFNQHHKQCHGCTTCPHAEKVVKFLRKRKYWACGFCSALHPARERHVEHVARHFESGMTKGEWMHSRVVYGLLHQPLIHEAWDALVNSRQSEYGGRRPRFSWHPSKTGRAQGFLEKENPGQLQDLLEFFSGDEGEAQWIASVAYDLADIVMDNVQLTPPHYPNHGGMPSYQDPNMSFAPLPSHQPMLPSSEPTTQHAYAPGFPNSILMSSPGFSRTAGPSPPDSTTHSPLASSHSPNGHSAQGGVKQEPNQSATHANDGGEAAMDFEYSPAPVVFEDWESIGGQTIDDSSPTQPVHGGQPGWGMMQYYNDPRVAS